MFVVIVDIVVKKEYCDKFRDAIVVQGKASRESEPGCLGFEILQDPGEPCRFTLCESYASEAAFKVDHRKTPHFARYAETTASWVESKSARTFLRVWPE